jgi:hypothetical protein
MKRETNNGAATLKGLARQRAFLDTIQAQGNTDDSFFVTEKVMESMRDSGYRDIRRALNDLIDNSKQANAKNIAVVTTVAKEQVKGATKEKISNIAIVDDGHGMYPEMLEIAVKWGGTDRHDERDGFGRFGFGLPTASISVTRVYEVYSKVKDGQWHKVTVDLNEVARKALTNGGDVSYTPKSEAADIPQFVKDYIKDNWKREELTQGTVVVLVNPDRIRRFTVPATFDAKMVQNVGLTYRHFIPETTFWVNAKKVQMVDPLFLNPNGYSYDIGNGSLAEHQDDMTIQVDYTLQNGKKVAGNIDFRISMMHPRFQREKNGSPKGDLNKPRFHVMKENNAYFNVCRDGRQIDLVRETYYQDDDDNITLVNYDANWAIELDFEPTLDELFGITTNKQQVEIDAYLWDIFKEHNIPSTVKTLRSKLSKLRREADIEDDKGQDEERASETVMRDAEKIDKLNLPEEELKKAEDNLNKKAAEIAEETSEQVEVVKQRLEEEGIKKRYKVEFTALPGAPFYDVEQMGSQTILKINSSHKFYSDVYQMQESRGKTALELLLFVLGKCELEAGDNLRDFYSYERYEWSKKLDLRLKKLDSRDPVIDKQAYDEEVKVV